MTSHEIQMMIVRALRDGEQLDHYELAKMIDQAPFRVRAELRALKRDRYVREQLSPEAHTWTLTPPGERLAWKTEQREMFR